MKYLKSSGILKFHQNIKVKEVMMALVLIVSSVI